MEYSAITHYMEKRYCYAIEKGKFVIRIEVKKGDMERVVLHCRDKYIPLQFHKNYSPQVLKANMRVVGNTEYAILLYRNRLPKFNNGGRMVFNNIPYPRDTDTIKVHPTQKSVPLLRYLIELFTDEGDVVIDPCAGSGSTLLAAAHCRRKAYGFEIKKDFYKDVTEKVLKLIQPTLF
jgi:site-specific DNA-methyltransferase (adenine-specific)